MRRDPVELEILLEHSRDQVQTMAELLAAVVANAGGVVELKPEDLAASRGRFVEILSANEAKVAIVRLATR